MPKATAWYRNSEESEGVNGVLDAVPRRDDNRAPTSDAGWSSLVARWAHNPKVEGSNPSPATNQIQLNPLETEDFSR